MIEKHMRLPFTEGPTPRMSAADVQAGIDWAGEHFWWMLPGDEKCWDISWILGRASELVLRHGIRGLVIDPWNELEPQRAAGETETEYISRVLRVVRQWARQHSVHVWMVVHPTKMYRDDNGKYPVPTLYDCAGSSHWRNKADNGLCVWRNLADDVTQREVDIYIQKIRFRQIGRLGKVTLVYDPPTARYDELPDSSQMPPRHDEEQPPSQLWNERD
jgi:twinkle protein